MAALGERQAPALVKHALRAALAFVLAPALLAAQAPAAPATPAAPVSPAKAWIARSDPQPGHNRPVSERNGQGGYHPTEAGSKR